MKPSPFINRKALVPHVQESPFEPSAEYLSDFLSGEFTPVAGSSNVSAMQFFPAENKLMVEYGGTDAYLYSNVSPREAARLISAASVGGACWDILRVRGSATATRKPFVKLGGGGPSPTTGDETDLEVVGDETNEDELEWE
jgi:hypothetical protein